MVQPPLVLPERPVPHSDGKKEIRSRLVLPWVCRWTSCHRLCLVLCLPGVVCWGDIGIPGRIQKAFVSLQYPRRNGSSGVARALGPSRYVERTQAPEGSGARWRNTVANVDPGQKPGELGQNRGFGVAKDDGKMRQGAGDCTRQRLGMWWPSVSLQRIRKA